MQISLHWSSDDQDSMFQGKTSLPTNQFTRSYKWKDSSYPSFLEFLGLLLGGLEGWAQRYGVLSVRVTDVMQHNDSSYRS